MTTHVTREEFTSRLAEQLQRRFPEACPTYAAAYEVAAEIALTFYANGYTMTHTTLRP